jgi:hypothetical protein
VRGWMAGTVTLPCDGSLRSTLTPLTYVGGFELPMHSHVHLLHGGAVVLLQSDVEAPVDIRGRSR